MSSVPISKFKAQCLALLENVRKTGKPLRITRFGKPIADIVPAAVNAPSSWLGLFPEGQIHGDLLAPVVEEHEWEVLGAANLRRPSLVDQPAKVESSRTSEPKRSRKGRR